MHYLELNLEQFDYVGIDEGQDMNALDIKTIKKMMNPSGSMVAFTDDAQSLYDWTGADRVRAMPTCESAHCCPAIDAEHGLFVTA